MHLIVICSELVISWYAERHKNVKLHKNGAMV